MGARNEFLKVDARRLAVKFSRLSASADDQGALRVSFEVHAGEPACMVEMNGYLPVPPTFAARAPTAIELTADQCEELLFYQYDHLPFRRAKVAFAPRGEGQLELWVEGQVIDTGDANRELAISARAVAALDQLSVGPRSEREARAVLARTGLEGEFVWTRMSNGLWTFYSPTRARSEAAFEKLLPRIKKLSRARVFKAAGLPVERAALHASPALLRRAEAALRAEVEHRWPREVRALLPAQAAELDDLLAI